MRPFKEQFSYDQRANSDKNATFTDHDDPQQDRTIQSFKDSSDINIMLERFGVRKVAAQPQELEYYNGEFDSELTYAAALDQLRTANNAFATVPAELRARFDNDPGKFLGYINDKANADEARKLGLLKPLPPPVQPISVRVIPEPTPPPREPRRRGKRIAPTGRQQHDTLKGALDRAPFCTHCKSAVSPPVSYQGMDTGPPMG